MLRDMDKEMEARGLRAILVLGDSTYGNPELSYVVGSPLPRGGAYLKERGREPTLIVGQVDLGSAEKSSVKNLKTFTDYGYEKILAEYGVELGSVYFYDRVLKEHGIVGKVGLYGKHFVSTMLHLADKLRGLGHEVVGEPAPTILDSVRETKGEDEIGRIRDAGRRTARVVLTIQEFLRECPIRGGKLYYKGKPLTVKLVKSRIRSLLAEEGLIAAHDTIFAVGPRSADPHYHGEDDDLIPEGEPIVFDIFPQEVGGYCYDTTRTFTVGRPSRKLKEMYEAVLETQLLGLEAAKDGAACSEIMGLVCGNFERLGYKTVRTFIKEPSESRKVGFIHSLGHGVGLTIGERPYLSLYSNETLKPAHVATVEPGLYDPAIGGVRIEDVIVIRGSKPENLTELPKDLVL